jgi:dihydrofolate reductase
MPVHLYSAISLEGAVAGPKHELDWLADPSLISEDLGYERLLETVEVIVMGRTTWEFCASLEAWPYPDHECILVSTTHPEGRAFDEVPWDKEVWIVGGARLIGEALDAGYVSRMTLTVHPVLLGQGAIPFSSTTARIDWRLIEVVHVEGAGLAHLVYEACPGS